MIVGFDLDGTLVDTYDAVLAAYRSVGVEPPEGGWWGRPWHTWLDSPLLHKAKNEQYEKFLHLARPLPHLDQLKVHISRNDHVYILTGASREAAVKVLMKFAGELCTNDIQAIHFGLNTEDKIERLTSIAEGTHTKCVYYDDDFEACQQIRDGLSNRWVVNHVVNRRKA